MDARATLARRFLQSAGWGEAAIEPLAGDASNRRYDRLMGADGRGAVLMDAPPDRGEDVRPFISVTDILRTRNLSAPQIYAADAEHGFLLIEDLGDDLFARVCAADPGIETRLYEAAVDVLAKLHEDPAGPALPPYDLAVLMREAALVTDWYLPTAKPKAEAAQARRELDRAIKATSALMIPTTLVTVLRDYHAENLLWLPGRSGRARVGLLDYQDALAGHAAYDLVSLLEDARRDTGTDLRNAMIARYLDASGADADEFRASYAALGAQRNLKIIGIFARLSLRDGKTGYPAMIPRVWDHLQRDLAHPALQPVKDFAAKWLPVPDAQILRALEGPAP